MTMLANQETFSLDTEDYSYQHMSCFEYAAQDSTCFQDQSVPVLATDSKKIKKKRASRAKHPERKEKVFWKTEEDAQVLELIQKMGFKWTKIGRIIGDRTGKQVRDRYNHTLDPNISKEKWSQQEDDMLYALYQQIGKKWCQIAQHMPGRTENQIKNRFHSKLKFFTGSNDPISPSETPQKSTSDSGDLSPIADPQDIADLEQASHMRGLLDRFLSRDDLFFGYAKEDLLNGNNDVYLSDFSEGQKGCLSESTLMPHRSFLSDDVYSDYFSFNMDRENEMSFMNNL